MNADERGSDFCRDLALQRFTCRICCIGFGPCENRNSLPPLDLTIFHSPKCCAPRATVAFPTLPAGVRTCLFNRRSASVKPTIYSPPPKVGGKSRQIRRFSPSITEGNGSAVSFIERPVDQETMDLPVSLPKASEFRMNVLRIVTSKHAKNVKTHAHNRGQGLILSINAVSLLR
jgi:hypothetical protein